MHLRAICSVCGATEREALLGAFIRHVGGIGSVALVECRDQRECWRRREAKENGPAADTNRAA